MSACQTLRGPDSAAKGEDDLLNTQKNIVINYINQSQANMALKELRPLVNKYPQDADFKNLLGLTYLSLQNPKMAQGFFQESYRLQPRASVALNLSSAYIENAQYATAMKLLKDLKSSKTGKEYQFPERILHNIGLCAERLSKNKVAEKYYKLAIDTNPYYYLSIMRLGQLYERTQGTSTAMNQYLRAREVCMKCYDPVDALARNYIKLGDSLKAASVVQSFLAEKDLTTEDRLRARKLLVQATKNDPKNSIHAHTGRTRVNTQQRTN
jgi:Tfp pilus assembly protein PilF